LEALLNQIQTNPELQNDAILNQLDQPDPQPSDTLSRDTKTLPLDGQSQPNEPPQKKELTHEDRRNMQLDKFRALW